jgi:hypothetical protein
MSHYLTSLKWNNFHIAILLVSISYVLIQIVVLRYRYSFYSHILLNFNFFLNSRTARSLICWHVSDQVTTFKTQSIVKQYMHFLSWVVFIGERSKEICAIQKILFWDTGREHLSIHLICRSFLSLLQSICLNPIIFCLHNNFHVACIQRNSHKKRRQNKFTFLEFIHSSFFFVKYILCN